MPGDQKRSTYFSSFFDASWMEGHDGWSKLSDRGLRKVYESFNEIRLFHRYKPELPRAADRTFLEFGCATGELYRYMRRHHSDLRYDGADISTPAIERAKRKYPEGRFHLVSHETPPLEVAKRLDVRPAIVFARDVVLHQPNPFEFLRSILAIPADMFLLRLRTKDRGPSLVDPEEACQGRPGQWAPYMIFNTDELVEAIHDARPARRIHLVKNYMVLGGKNGRYLPKECYDPAVGTAETAVYVEPQDRGAAGEPKVIIEAGNDSNANLGLLDRNWRYLGGRGLRYLLGKTGES